LVRDEAGRPEQPEAGHAVLIDRQPQSQAQPQALVRRLQQKALKRPTSISDCNFLY
jgi:hypothetical protein